MLVGMGLGIAIAVAVAVVIAAAIRVLVHWNVGDGLLCHRDAVRLGCTLAVGTMLMYRDAVRLKFAPQSSLDLS